jgi:prophage DNA circulation protein
MAKTDVAYLDGILLEMEDISDSFQKAIARFERPYVDGADLEDMGQKARTVRIRCYFFDNAAQATYDDHLALVDHLKNRTASELNHPKYGVLAGMVEAFDVRHDDRERCAEVDITFVERGRAGRIPAAIVPEVDTAVESAFVTTVQEQTAAIAEEMAESGLDTTTDMVEGTSLLAQITGVTVQARAYARQIDTALGHLAAYASTVTQPVNSLTATINYGASIPGRILGTVDQAVERVARLHDAIESSPSRFQAGIDFGLLKIEEDLDTFLPDDRHGAKAMLLKQVKLSAARRLALETAYIYAADRDGRRTQRTQASATAFDQTGKYSARQEPDTQPMNVAELEQTLAAAGTRLQAAVDAERSLEGLKAMALALVDAVNEVKVTAENVATVAVDNIVPLHLICLRYGLPYADAERLVALNPGIRNPSFIEGEVKVYV